MYKIQNDLLLELGFIFSDLLVLADRFIVIMDMGKFHPWQMINNAKSVEVGY